MKCVSEKWKEAFVVNELSFEPLKDSCTLDGDTPIIVAKDVLKYPEQVREFMENGYWWENGGDIECVRPGKSFDFGPNTEIYFIPLVEQFRKFYNADELIPIEFYGNCYNGDMNLYSPMSYIPHVDTFPGDDQNENPLNEVAFNMNLTKSDKVKTCFYSFNNKKSICEFTAKDYADYRSVSNKQGFVEAEKWREIGGDEYENYKLEYVADIDYNSLILYPSHYWHNAYMKENWFVDEDRVTFTGFFELVK